MGEKPNKLLDVSIFFFSTEELGFWMDFRWVSLFEQQMSRRVGLDMGVSPANNRIYLSMYIYIHIGINGKIDNIALKLNMTLQYLLGFMVDLSTAEVLDLWWMSIYIIIYIYAYS